MKRLYWTIFDKKLLIILIFAIFLTGCGDKDTGLSINPEINVYSPVMSSVPGIGLIAEFSRDLKNSDYKFHWVAEEGTFLTWHNEGKGRIEVLGNDIKTNEHKVYWSVDGGEEIRASAFKIYLTVEQIETSEVMYETALEIKQKEKGIFSIED